MLPHRPMHPEHLFIRAAELRPRTSEVVIQIPTQRGISADTPPRTFIADIARNRLLAAFSPIEQELLAPVLERTMLAGGQKLIGSRMAPAYLYFPETAVVALQVSPAGAGRPVDIATVGSEGVIGVAHLLGGDPGPEMAVARVAGAATRISVAEFDRAAAVMPVLRTRLLRYAASLMNQVAQTALCVQAHTIEQRLASLILLIAERVDNAPIVVTHEELGQMLGIRRPGVTQVAATLRERGLIGYRRGKILVTDHSGLLATACPCYRIVHDTLVRAISPDGTAPQLGGGRSLA